MLTLLSTWYRPPIRVFMRDGKCRHLPEGFEVPVGAPKAAFQMWCCGNPSKGWPPLRMARPIDAGADKKIQRRFSEYRTAMSKIETHLRNAGTWIENPTLEQVNNLYLTVANDMFPKKDGKRPISWTTYVRQKQPDKKRKQVQQSGQ